MTAATKTQRTPSVPTTTLSDSNYRNWAESLVGRDWEIFWREGEDGIEDSTGATTEEHDATPDSATGTAPGTTPMSGREATTTAEAQQIETITEAAAAATVSIGDSDARDGSVIDDWYDAHVLEIIDDTAAAMPIGENGWKFRVRFVGDEETYDLCLVPGKVRPSARGWIKRTVALLNPTLTTATTGESHTDSVGEESFTDLPPDTSTVDDRESLEVLKSKLVDPTSDLHQRWTTETHDRSASLPVHSDFRRIQMLRYHLESQIHLRTKLSKIENHSGKQLYTDGVRNPTESYVNHLVQCCRDLVQACSWYCNSWKLLLYYFGDAPAVANKDDSGDGNDNNTSDISSDTNDTEKIADLGKLTFQELITNYLEFGKDTIVNTAMIDTSSSGPSGKRRQPIAPSLTSSSHRRTKRRRKVWTGSEVDEENDDGTTKVLAAASKVDGNMVSVVFVDAFVTALSETIHYRHMAALGNMLRSLSHLVVDPLTSWKNLAGRILGESSHEGKDGAHSMLNGEYGNLAGDSDVAESDENDDGTDEVFTYGQIQSCLSSAGSNSVLSRFDLADDVQKLRAKLGDIETNHGKALELLTNIALATNAESSLEQSCYKKRDEILSGLTTIAKRMDSLESSLYNVHPLTSKEQASTISRTDLSHAIQLRIWFLDVEHTQYIRERSAFVKGLLSQIEPTNLLPDPNDIPVLANLPQISERRDASIRSISEMQTHLKTFAEDAEQRENDFLKPSSSVDISNGSERDSYLVFLRSTLAQCKGYPVIFPLEEKIAARIDLIEWYERVNQTIFRKLQSSDQNTIASIFDLETQYKSLQGVLRGTSSTRANLIKGLEPNNKTDEEVCAFLSSDQYSHCEKVINDTTELYRLASSWKERAESVISCLRTHGNANTGESTATAKPSGMVDIKRVVDLTEEYPKLRIEIHGYIEQLKSIQSEAFLWSQNIYTTLIEDDSVSFTDALPIMERERDQRPKGIIVYPNRSVVDAIIDLLSWHGKIKGAAKAVAESLKGVSARDDPLAFASAYSNLITNEIYPILADGSEALEIYCGSEKLSSNGVITGSEVKSDQLLASLDKRFRIRKTSKALSAEKINSNQLVTALLTRMKSKDDKEGFPLLLMLWYNWHLSVEDFVSKCKGEESSDLYRDQVLSLDDAKKLQAGNPFLSVDANSIKDPDTRFLIETKSMQLVHLEQSIEEARRAKSGIKEGFAKTKDLLRGSLLEKGEAIKEHLNSLKATLSMTKARSLGKGGLSLNQTFDNSLEQHIKYFTWLVKTLQYPVLHEGEASFSASNNENRKETSRITWDTLVNLHDRIPNEISGSGSPILCILRVRELYGAAKMWQDEVCRSTMISKRGNKRRGAKQSYQANSLEVDNKNTEKDAKIRLEEIESLAEDPILTKVDMPRHKAVKTMLDTSRNFEIQLENFLAQDFEGNQDNAPLPKGDSLVGRKGQFILYRLTGSSLFSMMQSSVQSLSEIGDGVFAETRGKAAFDWMRSAVEWIQNLQDAVVSQRKFTDTKEKILVVPAKDARELCRSGETIFLQTTKDMTQTLSNHGIYVSSNSIKKSLIVRLKKDGAHHSVGGIIIRWCPILFNALRADVAKLGLWESKMKKISYDFETFLASSSDNDPIDDRENLFEWYCYGIKVRSALKEGQNSLVVSPSKDMIDEYTDVLGTITNYLNKNCPRELNEEFSKRLFSNSMSLYDDRFELLDALLYRQKRASIAGDEINELGLHRLEPITSFRDRCRFHLENALLRATAVIGLGSQVMPNVEHLCALRAWEIEAELFEMFQGDFETTHVLSEDYREKARSLKSNLEKLGNVSLSLNVLVGDIKANALVKMTPAQMASAKEKLERERAKTTAPKEKVLTPGVEEVVNNSSSQKQTASKSPLLGILRNKGSLPVIQKDPLHSTEFGIATKLKIEGKYKGGKVNANQNADGAPTMGDSDEESAGSRSKLNFNLRGRSDLNNSQNKLTRPRSPPPPPSLVGSFNTSANGDISFSTTSGAVNEEDRGIRVSNAFGGKSFRVEIQGREKYTFLAAFYQEDESQATVNTYLSETLTQKGRSKIDDFHGFVSEKLRGGRWQATCLRMTTINSKDADIYREFYKEYETKERIAMFKLYGESGSKMFLVTPKFHQIAKQSREIRFGNKNSTYAIVLTKKDDGGRWSD
eukprot:jgi/Psemu1/297229/fgenesh1_pm.260_\